MSLTLDEAIESAKLSAGPDRIINQQHYEDLIQKLPDESRYPFTMALAELNIGPRTGHREASAAVSAFLDSDTVSYVLSKETGLSDQAIEDKLVYAAMHRDAGWWDDIKNKAKEWWRGGPADEYEEEFGEPFPTLDPGTEDMYDTETEEEITDYDFFADEPLPPPPVGVPQVDDVPQAVPDFPPPPSSEFPPEVEQGFGGDGSIPPMSPVESSNLESVGYDAVDRVLYIIFKTKRRTPRTMYRYTDVDEVDYASLLSAESSGKYFNQHIKNSKPYSGPEDPAAYGI